MTTDDHEEPGVIETLAPFQWAADGRTLQAVLQRPFKPHGLMLWDVPPGAQLMIFIGTNLELVASYGPLPARWFSAWESFQHLAAKLDAGLEPPGWGTWSAVSPGVMIQLRFALGDSLPPGLEKIEAVMWGLAVKR